MIVFSMALVLGHDLVSPQNFRARQSFFLFCLGKKIKRSIYIESDNESSCLFNTKNWLKRLKFKIQFDGKMNLFKMTCVEMLMGTP
jgi:hypothetical protein